MKLLDCYINTVRLPTKPAEPESSGSFKAERPYSEKSLELRIKEGRDRHGTARCAQMRCHPLPIYFGDIMNNYAECSGCIALECFALREA
jgi:hypothetical protein